MTATPQSRPELRALIQRLLINDTDLDAFVGDNFPEVRRRYTNGMDRVQKVSILLDYADLKHLSDQLRKLDRSDPGVAPLSAPTRIKILYLAANPTSVTQLGLAREARQIEDRLATGRPRDALELVPRWAVRPGDLQRVLLEEKPHILHFSCHGSPREQLILEDDQGAPARVEKEALVNLIGHLPGNLRLVVLNACDTESIAEALVRHVDCAIGMKVPIGDAAAIAFAAAFYQALGFGESVDAAYNLGKNQLQLLRIPEDQTPRLEVKPGTDASRLVLAPPR